MEGLASTHDVLKTLRPLFSIAAAPRRGAASACVSGEGGAAVRRQPRRTLTRPTTQVIIEARMRGQGEPVRRGLGGWEGTDRPC